MYNCKYEIRSKIFIPENIEYIISIIGGMDKKIFCYFTTDKMFFNIGLIETDIYFLKNNQVPIIAYFKKGKMILE